MKKILALILTLLFVLTCAMPAYAADTPSALQFGQDGKFKILIFADPQDGYPLEPDLLAFMNQALDKTKPDFVVLLGDNVMSPKPGYEECYWDGYDPMLEPIVSRGLPFSFVFGNHDHDGSRFDIPKETMLEKYQTYAGCMAYDADPSLHGCATHNLEILSSDGSHTAFNLWFFDSGEYVRDEEGNKLYYDCVRADQVAWYEKTSRALEEKNGGKVPSLSFLHMIPADVAQQVCVTLPFHLNEKWTRMNMADGSTVTYLPNLLGFQAGLVAEGLSPSPLNEGFWDAMVNRGDVLAAFFGHDHRNTFQANVRGVEAINVPGCTYHAYASPMSQGAMVLTLDEKDLSKYEKTTLYTTDLALEPGSKLPELSRSRASYAFGRFLRNLIFAVLAPLRVLAYFPGRLIYGGK